MTDYRNSKNHSSTRHPDHRHRNNHGGTQQRSFDYNKEYLKDGYYLDEKCERMRREIIVEEAEKVARDLAASKTSSSVLRRFFTKLRAAYDQYHSTGKFDLVVNRIEELIPAAEYSMHRGVVKENFKWFIRKNVNLATQSPENLKGFLRHYQSVLSFFVESK